MKRVGVLISLLTLVGCANQPRQPEPLKPPLYTITRADRGAVNQLISKHYSRHFTIIHLPHDKALVHAKVAAGKLPYTATNELGLEIEGYLSVLYVIATNGLATNPVVVTNTNPRFYRVAMDAMRDWRFEPARLQGRPVATTALQEFHFQPSWK